MKPHIRQFTKNHRSHGLRFSFMHICILRFFSSHLFVCYASEMLIRFECWTSNKKNKCKVGTTHFTFCDWFKQKCEFFLDWVKINEFDFCCRESFLVVEKCLNAGAKLKWWNFEYGKMFAACRCWSILLIWLKSYVLIHR